LFRLKAVKVLMSCILALSLSLTIFTAFAELNGEDSEVSTAAADEMLETWIDTYVYYINRVNGIPESPQDALNLTEGGPTNGPILFDGINMKMPEIGEPCGATTYRWSDKWMERQAWEVARNLPRETDYWISAIQFEGMLDVYEYMEDSNPKKAEVRQLIIDLYEGYWFSGNHPTWDVNFPDQNYYNDDQAWWSMALSRGFRLIGDIRMLHSSDYLITKTFLEWDDTDWAAEGYPNAFGGAPWGGIPWRRVGNDVAVGLGSWANSNANKNFCTEGNACYAALTLASTYKDLAATTEDPALKAKYQAAYEEQFAAGSKSYEWNKFHYINMETGQVTNGSYRLTGTVNHARDGVTCPTRADPYNHGTAAGSSYQMYVLTGDGKYRDEAKILMDYAIEQWTLSDGLTADCQGTGDDAAWKNILWYIAAEMCYNGGFTEYEKYFEANAIQAWTNRNDVGLCNNALQFISNSRQASICTLLGVNFLYWSDFDADKEYDYDLIGPISNGVNGVYQAEWAQNEYIQLDTSQAGYTGTGYTQYWDADGPHVQDGWVRFDVNVPETGIYKLDIRWYTRGDNTRRISINGGPDAIFYFSRGTNNTWETIPYYALLNEGLNTVKFTYYNRNSHGTNDRDGNSWCFMDNLTVGYLNPYDAPTQSVAVSATGPSFATTNYFSSTWASANNTYVEYTVSVPEAGDYDLNFFYTNFNTTAATRVMSVNGSSTTTDISFPRTGPAGSTANDPVTNNSTSYSGTVLADKVALKAGVNTIRLSSTGTGQQSMSLFKYVGVKEPQKSVKCGEEMMEDFIAAYMRDHYDYEGNIVGKSTWRWSDNPDHGGGSTFEKRRETDFWLSAPIYDSFNDALLYSKNPKYIAILDSLFESFIDSKWHPTWDVHDWMDNTYTDDVIWWCQAFERSYSLTGDRKYLDMSAWMWEEIMKSWDETVGYGGAPYGGFFWRRTAGDNVVNPLNASKNICSNLNSVICATRLSKSYASIDPVKSAAYLEQAKKGFAWSRAHLLRETDYYIWDNINYGGSRNTGQHSYNYGNFAGAAYQLYSVTGEQDYLDIMHGVMRKAWSDFTQSDNLTITGSEGTGDGSAFRMILIRQTASIVYEGGFTEYEKYLDWNATQAYNRRRVSDGLCGVNFASAAPSATTDCASPNSMLGVVLAFMTHLDIESDFGVTKAQLLAKITEANGYAATGYSPQSFASLQEAIEYAQGIYDNPDAPNRRIAASVSQLNTAISGLRAVNNPAALALDEVSPAVFELEDGVYTDSISRATAITGYTGTGYLTGFNTFKQPPKSNYKESVSFYVDAGKAGKYNLPLRTAVYLKDEAYGKRTQTFNQVNSGNYGHTRDIQCEENGAYWQAAGSISAANPAWVQISLQKPTEINMVRIRTRTNASNRTQTFSLWGGLDQNNLVELKASQAYQFTQVTTSGRQLAGNYVDIDINPVLVKYLRIVGTAVSTGTFEVMQFEAYSPTRTAALYIDDVKVKDIDMPVNSQKLTGASWETGVISWQDYVIQDVVIPAGLHKIAIVSEGDTPDKYVFDKLTFPVPILEIDWSVVDDKVVGTLDNGLDNEYTGFLYLGIYDQNNRLVYTENQDFEVSAFEAVPFAFDVEVTKYPAADYLYKVFCWDKFFIPLTVPAFGK